MSAPPAQWRTAVCPQCGVAFPCRHRARVYCSRKCINAHARRTKVREIAAAKLRWRKNRPEHVKAYEKRYEMTHRAQRREAERRRFLKDPHKFHAKEHARRARRVNAPGTYTAATLKKLFTVLGRVCLCCHDSRKKITVDHVRPLAAGGSNDLLNLQPLCSSCNSKKGVKSTDYRTLAQTAALREAA